MKKSRPLRKCINPQQLEEYLKMVRYQQQKCNTHQLSLTFIVTRNEWYRENEELHHQERVRIMNLERAKETTNE